MRFRFPGAATPGEPSPWGAASSAGAPAMSCLELLPRASSAPCVTRRLHPSSGGNCGARIDRTSLAVPSHGQGLGECNLTHQAGEALIRVSKTNVDFFDRTVGGRYRS